MTRSMAPDSAIAEPLAPQGRFDLIVLAASAGGIEGLQKILAALPAGLDVPIAVVQHRTAREPQLLSQILKRVTPLRVKSAEEGERLAPHTVYVAPPDFHLVLLPDRSLELTDGTRIKHVLSSANPLLESAARVLKDRVIAVVLSGSGSDGTDGVQAVKLAGGIVIVQDPREALHAGMPTAAIQTGAVDYVVAAGEIAPLLVRLTTSPTRSS